MTKQNAGPENGKPGAEAAASVENNPELKQLEEAALKEAEGNEGKEEAKETPGKAAETKKTEEKHEKTPIDPEIRKKLNIPEKFVHIEDYAAWAPEAERQMSRLTKENDELKRGMAKMEGELSGLKTALPKKDEKPKEPELTDEERAARDAAFLESPTKALEELEKAKEKKRQELLEQEEVKRRQEEYDKWRGKKAEELKTEEEGMIQQFGQEKWEKELKPALAKIADERPWLQTWEECLAIHERGQTGEKARQEKVLQEEHERKQKEKQEATVLSGRGNAGGESAGSVLDKINSAKSLKELEAISIPDQAE